MPATTPKYALPYPLGTDLVPQGDDAIKALADKLEALHNGAWVALPLVAGWANFGSGYQVCEYRRTWDMVELRGVAAGPAGASLLATMPIGYRPGSNLIYGVDVNGHGRLDVMSAGALSVVTKAAVGYMSISGIRFQVSG